MAKCRRHIEEIAPWDVKLYEEVKAVFSERVKALGPAFAARLQRRE